MQIQTLLDNTNLDRLDAELLLAYILEVDRPYIKAHPERSLSLLERLRFFWYALLRRRNTPIAYITGHKAFFGLDFAVNKYTLVPRPETEQMVSLALNQIKSQKSKNILLIDVGTGSGCIPIALSVITQSSRVQALNEEKDSFVDPTSDNTRDLSTSLHSAQEHTIKICASDISTQALKMAKRNAKKHNANITFKHGNLLEPWKDELARDICLVSRVIITANLPYITKEQWEEETSIKKEPKSALVAGEKGLALYRELLEQLSASEIQKPVTLYFEIDPDQEQSIKSLIQEYYPHARIEIHHDLCDKARVVKTCTNKKSG